MYLARRLAGPLRGPHMQPHRPSHRRTRSTDVDCGRLLARRQRPRDAATPDCTAWPSPAKKKAESAPDMLRGRQNATPQAGPRDDPVPHARRSAGPRFFWHPTAWHIYTEASGLHAPQQPPGGYVEVNTTQVVDRKLLEASGHGKIPRPHVCIGEVDEETRPRKNRSTR